MTDPTDIQNTTMHFVARLLYNISPDHLDRRFEELDDQEWNAWHMKAVAIINAAEPLWRSRVTAPEDRVATVGTLQSLARMATVRGIPNLYGAESTMEKEQAVQAWINECADRYSELGRV